MVNFVYTEAKRAFMEAELDLNATDDIRVIWVASTSSCGTEEDTLTMGAFTTLDEFTGAGGYPAPNTGIQLDNEVVNRDDANDRAEFDADDELVTAVTAGAAPVDAIVGFKFITSFSLSMPLWFCDTGTNIPFTPNGGNIDQQWNVQGIMQLG